MLYLFFSKKEWLICTLVIRESYLKQASLQMAWRISFPILLCNSVSGFWWSHSLASFNLLTLYFFLVLYLLRIPGAHLSYLEIKLTNKIIFMFLLIYHISYFIFFLPRHSWFFFIFHLFILGFLDPADSIPVGYTTHLILPGLLVYISTVYL